MKTPTGGSPKSPVSSQAGLILVVDDEEGFRNNLFRSLAGTEFRIIGASGASEALKAIEKSHPRAILLDWSLPGGIDGFALLKALKSSELTRHIPVIMISGVPRSDSEKLAVIRAGADGFFEKIELMTPRERLRELLRAAVAKNMSSSKWRLLIVEDDAEVRGFIQFALARREFEVHFSSAGREGCRLAQDLKPNLILLDMGLPDINGVEVCKILRANPETKGIPILAMSALDKAAGPFQSALMEMGVDDYLPKPFGENELLQRMSQLLGRVPVARASADILVRGRVRLDTSTRRVWVGDRLIERVGYKQFDLLQALLKAAGGISREELQASLWRGGENSKALDMTVGRLRKVLGFGKNEGIIAIPQGYKLVG